MKTYRFDEIENKHAQSVSMFSKQPGNNDLERCINFLNAWNKKINNAPYVQYVVNTNIGSVTCVVLAQSSVEAFNDKGEKVGEIGGYTILSTTDLYEPLEEMNITII